MDISDRVRQSFESVGFTEKRNTVANDALIRVRVSQTLATNSHSRMLNADENTTVNICDTGRMKNALIRDRDEVETLYWEMEYLQVKCDGKRYTEL